MIAVKFTSTSTHVTRVYYQWCAVTKRQEAIRFWHKLANQLKQQIFASAIDSCDEGDVAHYKSNAVPGGDFSETWIRLFHNMIKNVDAQLKGQDANATQQEKAASAAEERMSGKDGISVWRDFFLPIIKEATEARAAAEAQAKKEEEAAKEAEAGR